MLRVGLIGCGAIGSVVARELSQGAVDGAELTAVFDLVIDHPLRVDDRDSLLSRSDVVVEAAGQGALREHGVAVREWGTDLLVVSIGALADEELEAQLRRAEGGRLFLCTGAIGGFDILRAAMLFGPLEDVAITSTKPSVALSRPWMDEAMLEGLANGSEPMMVFDGPARQGLRPLSGIGQRDRHPVAGHRRVRPSSGADGGRSGGDPCAPCGDRLRGGRHL